MKNTLLVGGVLVGAVAAAVLAWAVFGGDGEGRKAALQEPTQSGSIGDLTLSGVRGASQLPVGSFNWHAEANQYGVVSRDPLQALRVPGGEASPALFDALTSHVQVQSGLLNLTETEGGAPYLQFAVGNGGLTEFGVGKHEKIVLDNGSDPRAPFGLTAAGGSEPAPDPALVIGRMTFPNERDLPIYGVSGGPTWPRGCSHGVPTPIVIRRPLDHVAEALWGALRQQTNLGTIMIELLDPERGRPYITYRLDTVRVLSLTASAAAGGTPTEEFALSYRYLRVSSETLNSNNFTFTYTSC